MNDTARRAPELDAFLAGLPGDQQLVMRRYEDILARGGPDVGLVHMIEASLRAPDNSAMPEAEKAAAFARLFTTIQAATHESLDQVQVHADRLWGRLSNDEKRQIALNPSAAATIAIDAMRNDPMLAARINPVTADTPRGIETYQGGAAFGFMGAHFAALREQDSARAAEARQFADLGVSRADAATLSSVGVDRVLFERYLRDGFTQSQILSGARDANALGFKGREDMDIAMHAPSDLRAAAAAVAKAKTDAEREAALRHYEEMKRKYEQLPDNDPRKQHALDFIGRAARSLGETRAQIGNDAARTISHDQQAAAFITTGGVTALDSKRAVIAATNERALSVQPDQQRIESAIADFGLDPAPPTQAASTPDVVVAADATPVERGASRTAVAATTADATPAGTTPVGDNRTRVARAPAKLPSATV